MAKAEVAEGRYNGRMASRLENQGIPGDGGEQWLPVVGYESIYEVSDHGRVKRIAGGRGTVAGRVLTTKFSTNGYCHADLSRDDRKVRFGVHRLVAFAFLGPPPSPAHVVNHIDGDKANNRPSNLEWVTQGGNIAHGYRLGLNPGPIVSGEKNPRSKLTAQQVAEIRSLRGIVGARVLAKRYGVSRSAIQFIHQGKHWT